MVDLRPEALIWCEALDVERKVCGAAKNVMNRASKKRAL